MDNNRLLTILTDEGKEVLCEILFTHHSDETGKDYVVFVQQGTNDASAAVYVPREDGNGELKQIETDEEWSMLEDLLEDYANNMEQHEHSSECGHCDGGCGDDCDCGEEHDHECSCEHCGE